MDPITIIAAAKWIQLVQVGVGELIRFIAHVHSQGGLTNQQLSEKVQKDLDEALAAINAIGTQAPAGTLVLLPPPEVPVQPAV